MAEEVWTTVSPTVLVVVTSTGTTTASVDVDVSVVRAVVVADLVLGSWVVVETVVDSTVLGAAVDEEESWSVLDSTRVEEVSLSVVVVVVVGASEVAEAAEEDTDEPLSEEDCVED